MNEHLHPLFKKLLEPLMSKPRTQAELDALAKLEEQYNAGARQADATWWQGPHERSPGRTYEKRLVGVKQNGVPIYEQVEKGSL